MKNIYETNSAILKKCITIKEAAHQLSVSDKSIRRLIERGFLKPSRMLGKHLIPVGQIDKLLEETVVH